MDFWRDYSNIFRIYAHGKKLLIETVRSGGCPSVPGHPSSRWLTFYTSFNFLIKKYIFFLKMSKLHTESWLISKKYENAILWTLLKIKMGTPLQHPGYTLGDNIALCIENWQTVSSRRVFRGFGGQISPSPKNSSISYG